MSKMDEFGEIREIREILDSKIKENGPKVGPKCARKYVFGCFRLFLEFITTSEGAPRNLQQKFEKYNFSFFSLKISPIFDFFTNLGSRKIVSKICVNAFS